MPRPPRVLLLDNLDSFTHNLAQGLQALGAEVRVLRARGASLRSLERLRPSHLVVSPGPGHPRQARLSLAAFRRFAGRLPLLGVCLGHQALAQAFGGEVGRAARPLHGRASRIRHDRQGLFLGLPQGFAAGRYHSLAVEASGLPPSLTITAWADDGTVMALRHSS
ncbi:MAG TPA: aminodeoxychorismate/anthranilate synthase component II, partial [bacterium]|nr:aminodeoxychorismate/anthranilate synthase component II [bacterium]